MGTLYIVATPIGNLSDISFRALDTLKSVSFILCEDTRVSIKLLNHYDIKKKLISYHKYNEDKKLDEIIKRLKEEDLALISDAGTPLISDPGYLLVKRCREVGIEVVGIPGASAITTALSISGMDTNLFSFFGFLNTNNKNFNKDIDKIKECNINTIVLYESPKRIVKLVERLSMEFSNSKIFMGSDLTKLHERGFYGEIKEVYGLIKNDPNIEKGEYVVILEKKEEKEEDSDEISLEALIIDYMIKENISIKEAISRIAKEKRISKNKLYDASLNLKNVAKVNLS